MPSAPLRRRFIALTLAMTLVLTPLAGDALAADDAAGKPDYDTDFEGKPDTPRTCSHLVKKHVVSEAVMELSMKLFRMPTPAPACPAAPKVEPPATPAPCLDSRFSVWPAEWPMPPLEKPKPDPPKPLERWPVALRGSVAVWPEMIASGWGSLGLSAEIGARYHAFSAGVEVHGDPPLGALSYPNVGAVSFARLTGGLVVCAHFGWFAGCGVADAGRFIFPDHVQALPASIFYGSAGARARFEFPVAPPLVFLSTSMDLRAPIHPVSYSTPHGNIFEAAGPSAGFGLGLTLELPP